MATFIFVFTFLVVAGLVFCIWVFAGSDASPCPDDDDEADFANA